MQIDHSADYQYTYVVLLYTCAQKHSITVFSQGVQ